MTIEEFSEQVTRLILAAKKAGLTDDAMADELEDLAEALRE